jgi:TonB family protein
MADTGASARFLAAAVPGPVSFGLRTGVVLLPLRFASLDAGSQYLVARHELLHVKRRDALQSLVEELLVAVFWFYPWVWWIRRPIRLAREQAVDRATATSPLVRGTYIRTLLSFAGDSSRPLPTAAGMWRAHELRSRIDALYKEVTMSRSRVLASVVAASLALAGVAVLGASTFPLHSSRLGGAAGGAWGHHGSEEQPIRIGGDVKPPRKIKDVNPEYPADAKDAGIEGVVVVETVVDREGKVSSTKILRSVPELDQAAIDAIVQWEFEPTYVKGKPVSIRMTITINFTLAK